MTRFVTGGAGFIGANYLFYLREHYPDDRLVCIDKLTYAGDLSTLAPLLGQPNFRFAKVDICDREAVYGLFEEEHPDVVVNFAAESHVDRSIADPSLFLQTNIIGTSVLMDAAVFVQTVQNRQDVIISAPEEVAYHMGWLTKAQLLAAAARYDHSPYGTHLRAVAEDKLVFERELHD